MRKIGIIGLCLSFLVGVSGCSYTEIEVSQHTEKKAEQPVRTLPKISEKSVPIEMTPKIKESKTNSNSSGSQKSTSFIAGKVTNVVDGDTIDVHLENGKKERVRFILIDTPETKHPNKPVQPFGPEASKFTNEALLNKDVELELDVQERDRYGRLLAYVYIDGQMINETLLKKGLARVAIFPPNTKYVDQFEKLQNKAKQKGIGIWSLENYVQEKGFQTEPSKNGQKKQTNQPTDSFAPDRNGNCNGQIKGNQGSNGWIYHMPGGAYYKVTKAEECFQTEKAAQTAGYRKSSR